ncbi:MAG: GTPase [Nanoarchaeota archaeon]
MNFQDLYKIEDYKFYLDTAFGRARKKQIAGLKRMDPLLKKKKQDEMKVVSVTENLATALLKIEKSFPSMESLPEFYKEMCRVSFDVDVAKKSIGAVRWAVERVKILSRETTKNIRYSQTEQKSSTYREAFYGRVSSVMKRINKELKFLEEIRKIMKAFPTVKEKYPTVAIVGFPNVGKSTLLSKITSSKVEINSYAFTTKKLLVGYRKSGNSKIQFIDTPGTLNRDEKKNNIEKQAELAIKYVADIIVYVFDPTETYTLENQERLLKNVKKKRKPTILYMSKTDVADQDIVREISKKHKDIILDKEELIAAVNERLKKEKV